MNLQYLEKINLKELVWFVRGYRHLDDAARFCFTKENGESYIFGEYSEKPSSEEYENSISLNIRCYGVDVTVNDFELKQGCRGFLDSAQELNSLSFAKFMVKNLPENLKDKYVIDYDNYCREILNNNYKKDITDLAEQVKVLKSTAKRSHQKEEIEQ